MRHFILITFLAASLSVFPTAAFATLRDIPHPKFNSEIEADIIRKLAEKGDPKAQNVLGEMFYYGSGVTKDLAAARNWWQKAAEQGDINAQLNLGIVYEQGQGTPKNYSEAMKWFLKAAEQGDAQAQEDLGAHYYGGLDGVLQNYSEGVKWFQKAAAQGNSEAINNLGDAFEQGNGVPQDYSKAFELYTKAANLGNAAAYVGLGDLYSQGHGLQQDFAEAYFWYSMGADSLNNLHVNSSLITSLTKYAQDKTEDLAKNLTPSQIEAFKREKIIPALRKPTECMLDILKTIPHVDHAKLGLSTYQMNLLEEPWLHPYLEYRFNADDGHFAVISFHAQKGSKADEYWFIGAIDEWPAKIGATDEVTKKWKEVCNIKVSVEHT